MYYSIHLWHFHCIYVRLCAYVLVQCWSVLHPSVALGEDCSFVKFECGGSQIPWQFFSCTGHTMSHMVCLLLLKVLLILLKAWFHVVSKNDRKLRRVKISSTDTEPQDLHISIQTSFLHRFCRHMPCAWSTLKRSVKAARPLCMAVALVDVAMDW